MSVFQKRSCLYLFIALHQRFADYNLFTKPLGRQYLLTQPFLFPFPGAIHLAGPIAKISKGLCKLSLAHCGLTAKGVNQIAHSLSLNQTIPNSLTYLDLSGNNLKDDINNLYNFLAQPNVLEHLDISATDTQLENLFGALLRGCGTHLAHLNVSHNSFSTKKGKEIPPSFKQFFTSSLSLKHLNISFCKLPMEALK